MWHVDNTGVFTWVTLESNEEWKFGKGELEVAEKSNSFYCTEDDERVLKLWAIIQPDNEEEAALACKQFSEEGEDWVPQPHWIKVIALIRGDTLFMPPGTIHAPITVTRCLFRGGMVMQRRFLFETIKNWRFCVDNAFCTNENQPKQGRAVIDYLEQTILRHPEECGFDKARLRNLEENCQVIARAGVRCGCFSKCSRSNQCPCLKYGQRCGLGCHKGGACENPCGNEQSRLAKLLKLNLRSEN